MIMFPTLHSFQKVGPPPPPPPFVFNPPYLDHIYKCLSCTGLCILPLPLFLVYLLWSHVKLEKQVYWKKKTTSSNTYLHVFTSFVCVYDVFMYVCRECVCVSVCLSVSVHASSMCGRPIMSAVLIRMKLSTIGLISYRSSEKKVLNSEGSLRTFNRPFSKLLLLQFHAKAIVRLTSMRLAWRLLCMKLQ